MKSAQKQIFAVGTNVLFLIANAIAVGQLCPVDNELFRQRGRIRILLPFVLVTMPDDRASIAARSSQVAKRPAFLAAVLIGCALQWEAPTF